MERDIAGLRDHYIIRGFRHASNSIANAENCVIAMGETIQLARLETLAASDSAMRP
jgi:hypothetical protein